MKQNNFAGKRTEVSQQVRAINRNNMKFTKGKYTVLHLEGNNPMHWYMMRAEHTARSLAERTQEAWRRMSRIKVRTVL